MLVGFHGYAEDAETQMERLRAIPESGGWICVSIQALNRFYQTRTGKVVANWMTRQDREAAIADNIEYVSACIAEIEVTWSISPGLVFAGFSQGVAMAFRAAAYSAPAVAGVIAVGGDVPPELTASSLGRIPEALIVRGKDDHLYSAEQFAKDAERLRKCGVKVATFESSSGHEWSSDVSAAVSDFLRFV
ncbi:alpha/beta hydrolase [Nevskia soli]|jgi:predicted esterase|uniref:alpha/beta hydrolase n=1 Tax=Nevskia soli TaxID=418856 RepID=UPI0015D871ED|nr:phospholipase [Nevskia soli]